MEFDTKQLKLIVECQRSPHELITVVFCVHCNAADAMQEDADPSKVTTQNVLLKRLLNTSKTGADQSGMAAAAAAPVSRLSEVYSTVLHPSSSS